MIRNPIKILCKLHKSSMRFPKAFFLLLLPNLMLLLMSQHLAAQEPFKLFLVGDAGDHEEAGGTLVHLEDELNTNPNSAIVFLGDNCYRDIFGGLIHFGYKGFDSTKNTIDKIQSQLDILDRYQGHAFFVPGNHDWWNRTTYKKGKPKLAMEESFIQKNLAQNTHIANPGKNFLPQHGDYGPVYVELNHHTIRLIFIDTYRIIQTGIKKGYAGGEEKLFYSRLDSLLGDGYRLHQRIMVLAHHPVYATGPFIKSLKHPYLFTRIKASYFYFPSYYSMSVNINNILRKYPGVCYASGHVHALQYFFTKDSLRYIVSGAGSKEKLLSVKESNKYDDPSKNEEYLLWNSGGFFELDFFENRTDIYLHYNEGALKCKID